MTMKLLTGLLTLIDKPMPEAYTPLVRKRVARNASPETTSWAILYDGVVAGAMQVTPRADNTLYDFHLCINQCYYDQAVAATELAIVMARLKGYIPVCLVYNNEHVNIAFNFLLAKCNLRISPTLWPDGRLVFCAPDDWVPSKATDIRIVEWQPQE